VREAKKAEFKNKKGGYGSRGVKFATQVSSDAAVKKTAPSDSSNTGDDIPYNISGLWGDDDASFISPSPSSPKLVSHPAVDCRSLTPQTPPPPGFTKELFFLIGVKNEDTTECIQRASLPHLMHMGLLDEGGWGEDTLARVRILAMNADSKCPHRVMEPRAPLRPYLLIPPATYNDKSHLCWCVEVLPFPERSLTPPPPARYHHHASLDRRPEIIYIAFFDRARWSLGSFYEFVTCRDDSISAICSRIMRLKGMQESRAETLKLFTEWSGTLTAFTSPPQEPSTHYPAATMGEALIQTLHFLPLRSVRDCPPIKDLPSHFSWKSVQGEYADKPLAEWHTISFDTSFPTTCAIILCDYAIPLRVLTKNERIENSPSLSPPPSGSSLAHSLESGSFGNTSGDAFPSGTALTVLNEKVKHTEKVGPQPPASSHHPKPKERGIKILSKKEREEKAAKEKGRSISLAGDLSPSSPSSPEIVSGDTSAPSTAAVFLGTSAECSVLPDRNFTSGTTFSQGNPMVGAKNRNSADSCTDFMAGGVEDASAHMLPEGHAQHSADIAADMGM